MNWNQGYNVDLGYTYGHYREQDPNWMDLCAVIRGTRPPSWLGLPKLRYLELGSGQGVNLCVIAAQHPGMEFVGVDFNPQHIAHAQGLAHAAGLKNIRFLEADFVELGRHWPADLGHFHYVTAHGIYTWLADTVLKGLIACIAHSTTSGALVYLSYNTLPGWLSSLPVQHLLRLWQVREELSSLKAIDLGRERLLALLESQSGMTQLLPGMRSRLDKFPTLDRSYLIQEYLHDNWHPKWFDQIESELAPAKMRYVGTATSGDWMLPLMLPENAKAIYNQYTDSTEREVMLDVLVNQGFRRDLWARGHTPLWAGEQRERLMSMRFALVQRPSAAAEGGPSPYKYPTSLGEVQGHEDVYGPLYEALASGSKSLKELIQLPALKPRQFFDTLQAVGLMLNAGHISLAHALSDTKPAKALNRAVAQAAAHGAPYKYIIATATPNVLTVSDSDLMLMSFWLAQQKLSVVDLAERWVDWLVMLGRGLKKGDQTLSTREAMLPRAQELAEGFLKHTLPGWQSLGVL